jgi:hypothetical protein
MVLDRGVPREEDQRPEEQAAADLEDGGRIEGRNHELEGDGRDQRADAEAHDQSDPQGRQPEEQCDRSPDEQRRGADQSRYRCLTHRRHRIDRRAEAAMSC